MTTEPHPHGKHTGPQIVENPRAMTGLFATWCESRRDMDIVTAVADPADVPPLALDKKGRVAVRGAIPPASMWANLIERGDVVHAVGASRVRTPEDFAAAIATRAGKPVSVKINRGGKEGSIRRFRKLQARTRKEAAFELATIVAGGLNRKEPVRNPSASDTFDMLALKFMDWLQSSACDYSPAWKVQTRYNVERLRKTFGPYQLAELTPAMLGDWAVKRGQEVSGSTLGNEIITIRAMMNRAVELGYIETAPTSALKQPKQRQTRPKFLTPEEVDLVIKCAHDLDAARLDPASTTRNIIGATRADMLRYYNAAGEFDAARVKFLLLTGLRKSQLTSLLWSQYDRKRGTIALESRPDHTEKSRRVNVIPLPAAAVSIIEAQPRPAGCQYIFPNLRGGRDYCIDDRVKRIAARAADPHRNGTNIAVKDFHLHILRHTALTNLLAHSQNLAAVQKFAGHQDMTTTRRYAWVLDDQLAAITQGFAIPTAKPQPPTPEPAPAVEPAPRLYKHAG